MVGSLLIVRAMIGLLAALAVVLAIVAARRRRGQAAPPRGVEASPLASPADRPSAPCTTVLGRLENANRQGVKIEGFAGWLDYGTTFRGRPLGTSDIGHAVEAVLVHSTSGPYVRSIRRMEHGQVAEPSAPVVNLLGERVAFGPPASHPQVPDLAAAPTSGQIEYLLSLARTGGFSVGNVNTLALARFRKPLASLNAEELLRMIAFFGGYVRSSSRR